MNKKVFSAAILASAAMAMTSCSTSKNAQNENVTKAEKITEAEAARPSADEEMDESYLVLSEAQQNIVKKNNDFAFRLYQQISGMDSEVVSPMGKYTRKRKEIRVIVPNFTVLSKSITSDV